MSHRLLNVTELAHDDQKLEQKVQELVRELFRPHHITLSLSKS